MRRRAATRMRGAVEPIPSLKEFGRKKIHGAIGWAIPHARAPVLLQRIRRENTVSGVFTRRGGLAYHDCEHGCVRRQATVIGRSRPTANDPPWAQSEF